jgi:hypothetical protein
LIIAAATPSSPDAAKQHFRRLFGCFDAAAMILLHAAPLAAAIFALDYWLMSRHHYAALMLPRYAAADAAAAFHADAFDAMPAFRYAAAIIDISFRC